VVGERSREGLQSWLDTPQEVLGESTPREWLVSKRLPRVALILLQEFSV
jgi:hypothetical protein